MSTKKQVLITGGLHDTAFELLEKASDRIEYTYLPDLPREELLEKIGAYECIICRSETTVDREVIDRGKKLEIIARAAVGFGNIDVEYATEKGVIVFNTPGVNTNSAAELTLSLLLATLRKVVPCHKHMERGEWNRHLYTGTELKDKTVGIVGLGNVGFRVARFLRSFDARLLVYDPYITDDKCEICNAEKVNLEELISKSDIITVHTPLNKDTQNMIGMKHKSLLKQGVVFINAARGGIIEEELLLDGLKSGLIASAGIDTWDDEPPKDNPFKDFENVVMTSHIGASTFEAQIGIAERVVSDVLACFEGGLPKSPLNIPQMELIVDENIRDYSVLVDRLGKITAQYIGPDFNPTQIDFQYRGKFDEKNWSLIKLSFLKSFLSEISESGVSYVNALNIAQENGYKISESHDSEFTVYNSAVRIHLKSHTNTFSIGGTVLGMKNIRMTYFKDMGMEIEPVGRLLIIDNLDRPGVIGFIGSCLGQNGINVNQFHLGRTTKGDRAMCITSIDDPIPEAVLDELRENPNIISTKVVEI